MKTCSLLALLMLTGLTLFATETKIIVRAKAKDAKFIGSSLGGAYVIIRNTINQKILAEGITSGSTGNTNLIMKTPVERGQPIADMQTAKFLAVVDIDEPTFVSIEVLAPVNHKQARARVSTELWLIPGKHILGEGIILEVPGFIIDILKPRTHQYISPDSVRDHPLVVQANIVMMCGCTINKGGIWDANEMEVTALLKKNGKPIKNITLAWASTNLFEGDVPVTAPGNYELIVSAFNPRSGNTGVDKVNYVIYE